MVSLLWYVISGLKHAWAKQSSSQKATVSQGHYFRVLGRWIRCRNRNALFVQSCLADFTRDGTHGRTRAARTQCSCVIVRLLASFQDLVRGQATSNRGTDDRIRFDSKNIETCDTREPCKCRDEESNRMPEKR